MAAEFDVFLSYNSGDREVVERIALWLDGKGLKVWLDRWMLRPGFSWHEGLARGLQESRSVVVFLGAGGLGDWQKPEMWAAIELSRHARQEPLPVIPALLPGCGGFEGIDLFLRANTGVDLRPDLPETALERLLWGITGQEPEDLRTPTGTGASPKPSTAPFLHNLPYSSLGSLFQGRDEWLEILHKSLTASASNKATAIAGKAIHGLGGVGKTRLAVEYAWRYAEEYRTAFFVVAQSSADLRRNLAALAGPELLNLPEQSVPEEEVREVAVLLWLRANRGWLLILDNVDTEEAAEAVDALLPKLGGGSVLLTGRVSQWGAEVEDLRLGLLKETDAVAFLLARTQGKRRSEGTPEKDEVEARGIARELGCLPLALEQAGAYIAARSLSFARYRNAWQANREKVLADFNPRVSHYPMSIAVTWQTSVDQLTEPARRLLQRLAWLGPEPIPESLLEVAVPGMEPGAVEPSRADLLVELETYSLATHAADAPNFTVHRLVQEVTRQRSKTQLDSDSLAEALAWVDRGFVGNPQDVRTWPILEPLAPHARAVVEFADQAEIAEPTARLMNDLAHLYYAKVLLTEAEPLMRRALDINESSFGPDHPEVATNLNNLAQLFKATNRLAEAEPMMRRVVTIFEKSLDENHSNVAAALNNLAELLKDTNRLNEAEPLMRQALRIDEINFASEHPKVAIRLNNLALLLKATNRMAEAEPLMRRALQIDESSFGSEHPNVAIRLNNLAQLLQATNRLSEAEPLMRCALYIDENSFGADHPNVARDLSNLAVLLKATNRLTEAEPLMRRALQIDENTFGTDHPHVAGRLSNLAQLLQDTNRLAEAEPLMRRALQIDENSFGSEHPNVARDLNNLALFLNATNRSAEAEPLMRRVLEIDEKSFGPEHPAVALDLYNLAYLLRDTNRSSEAGPLMRRALLITIDFRARSGYEHPAYQDRLVGYRALLTDLGHAEPEIERLIAELYAPGAPPTPTQEPP